MSDKDNHPGVLPKGRNSDSKKSKRKARRRREIRRNWREFRKRLREGFWGVAFRVAKRVGQAIALLIMWACLVTLYSLATALGLPVELVTDKFLILD